MSRKSLLFLKLFYTGFSLNRKFPLNSSLLLVRILMDWLLDTYLIVLHITALEEISNRPFAAGGHMVQNPTYWRAKKCDKTPLGNVNKEKSHFSSFEIVFCFCFGVRHILLRFSLAYQYCTMWTLAAKGQRILVSLENLCLWYPFFLPCCSVPVELYSFNPFSPSVRLLLALSRHKK